MIEFLTTSDIAQMQHYLPYLVKTIGWSRNYLGKPHPDLVEACLFSRAENYFIEVCSVNS